jgi:phage gpG-like protein
MSEDFKPPDFMKIAEKLKKDRQRYAEIAGVNFIKSNFDKQGFTDASFTPWEKHKDPEYRPGGAILTSTGFLRDSIEVVESSPEQITFGSYAPYAKIHNEGGVISTTQNVREHSRTRKGKSHKVKSHSRTIKTKIPKRQFMGPSVTFMKELDEWTILQIQQQFNNI